MKSTHRQAARAKREQTFRIPHGKYWNVFYQKWLPDPEAKKKHVAQNDTTATLVAEIDVLRQVNDSSATLLEMKK